ncbi:hypothetical protein BDZ94DRAFT_1257110 [Collybia nuda]|uniref:Uncharacterized protein n=1 Tax=Collybia nuda TaxID=64659 RepID=A0A9P5YA72_9AGAR|nr:hypothetical protein BDZ94DRAFT_1257110 [Collybia nuda]
MDQAPPSHDQLWKKEDWLCLSCINQIFETRIGPWLLMQKRLGKLTLYRGIP